MVSAERSVSGFPHQSKPLFSLSPYVVVESIYMRTYVLGIFVGRGVEMIKTNGIHSHQWGWVWKVDTHNDLNQTFGSEQVNLF